MRRGIATVGVVALLVAGWVMLRPSAEERSARDDAAAVGSVVAEYITDNGRLPRLRVSARLTSSGEEEQGESFLVETREVARADATSPRLFNLVGTVNQWCVEMLFGSSATSPTDGVAVRGQRGESGGVDDGRCGEGYSHTLSEIITAGVPEAGTVINAASAPLGTCLTGVVPDGRSTAPLEVVGCGDEHLAEIYHRGIVTVGSYADLEVAAAEECAAFFPSFVGVSQQLSALTAEAFTSSQEQWQGGARQFSCALYLSSGDYPLVGSARDSWL